MKKSLQKFIYYTLTFLILLISAAAWAQVPVLTPTPTNGAVGVNQSADITISFSNDIHLIGGGDPTSTNIDALIILRLTNVAGMDIPFDATINVNDDFITINPTSNLPSGALIYFSIGGIEDANSDDDILPDPTSFTFTVADYVPPVVTFNPAGGSLGVSLSGNLTISFDEAVRKLDDSAIAPADLLTLVELKLTNNAGAPVPFTGSINGGNNIITIDPTSNLTPSTVYYLEINPIEDGSNNAITATNITFTTSDNTPPVVSFIPTNGTISVSETGNITINFDEAVRKLDDSAITPSDLLTLVELKLTNDVGAPVPFVGSINGGNNQIIIDPTSTLPSSTLFYVEMNPVEDIGNNATIASNITFTTGDTQPPLMTFNPLAGAINVPLASNLTITFNEPIRKLDDSAITPADLLTLVELKLTNDAGAPVTFTASMSGGNTILTIDPTSNLTDNTLFYLEINPVEDASNNAITATNITFTSIDVTPPTVAFVPINGAVGVVETNNITITFNEAVRKLDDSAITPSDLLTLVELKLTNDAGANVPFTATITGGNKILTIDPTATLAGNTLYYVEINPVEDASNNAIVATNITFTTGDTQSPTFTFSPLDNATNFSAVGNVVITFSEPIRKLDDTPITPADIQGGLIEFKLTNDAGAPVPFTATINGLNTIITLNPNSTLLHNQVFYIEVNPVEDGANNATIAQNIDFTTEDRPSITAFVPAANERCIGDPVTINGLRFTGTGNPITGNTKPTVYVNAVAVPAVNVTSFNSTQVIFTLPTMTPGNYPITVRNNDSDLLSAGSNFDVLPAIDQTISVTPATFNPAQNTNVDVVVTPTQDANYFYSLILTAAPGGYSVAPGSTVHGPLAGNSGSRTLNTAEGTDPDLTLIGDYSYRIDVARANCVTKTLNATPFTLTVASLAVNVSATDVTVCNGSSTTLIGQANGGTGFYQFHWTSIPAGYTSNSSSPTVSPTANIRYVLDLQDNAGNTVSDFIDVVVFPVPTADIVPTPPDVTVRTNYVLENVNYKISGTPVGGVFSGQGVTLGADGFYYFNPQSAGENPSPGWPIVYTYTDGNGCSDTDTENFVVNSSAVNGLDATYCENVTTDGPLSYVPFPVFPAGFQFTRLIFYDYDYNVGIPCLGEVAPTFTYCGGPNPLTPTSFVLVPDIQAGVTLPIGTMFLQPVNYTLNLNMVRNSYGYSYDGIAATPDDQFYILAYGKDSFGNESYRTYQPFTMLRNGAPPQIVGIDPNENICSDALVRSLSCSAPNYTVNNFTISGGFSGSLSGTNNSDFNPGHASLSGAYERPLIITMAYNDAPNNCPSSVTTNFNWVQKPNPITVSDVAFCQFADPTTIRISATANGPADRAIWYDLVPSNPSAQVLPSTGFILDPGISGTTPLTEDFFVSQIYKGCEGNAVQANLVINPAPNASITRLTPVCEGKDFTLSAPEETPGVPYVQYLWNFGDGTTSTVNNNNTVIYNYPPPSALSNKTIGLTVTTSLGCQNFDTDVVTVGQNPQPDFSYTLVCDGDLTEFVTPAPSIPISDYSWDFGDLTTIPKSPANNVAPEGGLIKSPKHNFSQGVVPLGYDVTLTAYTPSGCFDSKVKTLSILEYKTYTSGTPYDMASVDGGKGYWTLEDIAGNSTWEFAQPTSPVKQVFTSPAWVTNKAGNYSPAEYSFMNSPCLDITGIDRPVLSLDFVMNTDESRDGVVMEYSKNGGVNWFPLGGVNSGFNWTNTTAFFSGIIGSSTIGWSGNSWELGDNIARDTLVHGRRALDNIGNLSLADRAKVRFRIAFKTDNVRELAGFGFNNLTIASRNRVLLVENFTNEATTLYSTNETEFKSLSILEAVKIQYHVATPANVSGTDTNYPINTEDPSARAAYYGIPLTDQAIPRGYIDGYSSGNFLGTLWVQSQFSQRALKVAPFSLTAGTLQSSNPTYIKVAITAQALENIPATKKPILQIALVEKTAGTNEYVLRKLVPSAVGRKLTVPMAQSTIVNIVDSVRIENPNINISQLALIAFIQDEQTREVYQAAIDMNPTFLPTASITAIEDPAYAEKINLYPNPANHEVTIQLPGAVLKSTPVTMFDTYGRMVYENNFAPGESSKAIKTSELTGGVYIIQLASPDGKTARRKIMVMHQ